MNEQFSRTELLLGSDGIKKLQQSHVAVFGVGGVGGFAVEALARAGIGEITIVDHDTISISNINRQIIATNNNVGQLKVEAFTQRIKEINPDCVVHAENIFYLPETEDKFDFSDYDYIIDAIDTISGKIAIICNAEKTKTPVISSMGAGNKLDPTMFEVTDIFKTSVDPLARVMRRELKKRGINKLKVVYSKEEPIIVKSADSLNARKIAPGSVSFVPPVVGFIIAGEVIKDIAVNF